MSELYTGTKRNFYFGGLTNKRKRDWLKILTRNSGVKITVSTAGPPKAPNDLTVKPEEQKKVEQENRVLDANINKDRTQADLSQATEKLDKVSSALAGQDPPVSSPVENREAKDENKQPEPYSPDY